MEDPEAVVVMAEEILEVEISGVFCSTIGDIQMVAQVESETAIRQVAEAEVVEDPPEGLLAHGHHIIIM